MIYTFNISFNKCDKRLKREEREREREREKKNLLSPLYLAYVV